MEYCAFKIQQLSQVAALFEQAFTESEGESSGKTIHTLVENLVTTTDEDDLFGFCSTHQEVFSGCIFFSRLKVADKRSVFMLSPVAVAPAYQSKGNGQRLIRYGLEQMQSAGAQVIVTYGDPNYYSKTGFQGITQEIIEAPYPLAHPHGWQAQSLTSSHLAPIAGKVQCVEAFNNPAYW